MHIIEGTLIVINAEKNGASFVVPSSASRTRFASVSVRRDVVSLVDADGVPHVLDDISPTDAQSASAMGNLIVREMSIEDEDDFIEYAIAADVDLTVDSDHSSGGWTP